MNKTQKTSKCQEILRNYQANSIVANQDEISFLFSIFELHSDWDLKKGVGIKSISVIETRFNNKCFQINRTDGSYTDISFKESITNTSKKSTVKKACRTAIRDQVDIFRNRNVTYGVSRCPFTDEVLTEGNTHIDHYDLTFDEMFNLWIIEQNFDYLLSKVNKTNDNSLTTRFTDDVIIDGFILFHNSKCKLRAVSKNANLSILKLRSSS